MPAFPRGVLRPARACPQHGRMTPPFVLLGNGPCAALDGSPARHATAELERSARNGPCAHTATMADMVIAYAYNENPDIAAAREAWRAKVESYRVVTGLPDTQLTATYFPEPLQTRLGPQDWNVIFPRKSLSRASFRRPVRSSRRKRRSPDCAWIKPCGPLPPASRRRRTS